MNELELKYGCNPNQKPSRIFMKDGGDLPLTVLNGKPGYINFLDALNSWQLARELKEASGLPSAASFKHVSPAGAAVGLPLSGTDRKLYFVEPGAELTPTACAYIRARGADRLCSYGDWAALSDVCDAATAQYLKGEVSDGIIAPGYTEEALEILRTKKKGAYNVVQIDPGYQPAPQEYKDVFGVTFQQGRNGYRIGKSLLDHIVTKCQDLPQAAKIDMMVALITLKYTQSNSVCYVKDGQAIGVGAGHPLYPPGGRQGRQLVAPPAPPGPGPALCGKHPPPGPGQRHRRIPLRRVGGPAGGRRVAGRLHGAAPAPGGGGEKGLDCQAGRRHLRLRRLLPLWGQRGTGPEERRAVHRPARREHPGRPRDRNRR